MNIFAAPDAHGDETLWAGDPDHPTALLSAYELSTLARELLWPILLAHATGEGSE